jgi:hypothetical protein
MIHVCVYTSQYGYTALHRAVLYGRLGVAERLIDTMCALGKLNRDFMEQITLKSPVRDRLLLMFDKAKRRRHRLQILWMSSNVYIDDSNILKVLPSDLSRYVSNFF